MMFIFIPFFEKDLAVEGCYRSVEGVQSFAFANIVLYGDDETKSIFEDIKISEIEDEAELLTNLSLLLPGALRDNENKPFQYMLDMWTAKLFSDSHKALLYAQNNMVDGKMNFATENTDMHNLKELDDEALGRILKVNKFKFNNITCSDLYVTLPDKKEVFKPDVSGLSSKTFSYSASFYESTVTRYYFSIGGIEFQSTSEDQIKALRNALISIPESKNLLLFVNGYKNNGSIHLMSDFPDSGKDIYFGSDPFNYWEGIDKNFIDDIGTDNVVYADGHHSILTSNHNTGNNTLESKLHFAECMIGSLCASKSGAATKIAEAAMFDKRVLSTLLNRCNECGNNANCVTLDTEPNNDGFKTRYDKGVQAGALLLADIKAGKIPVGRDETGKITGKLDIVAHSMGYAYAVGMLAELKGEIPFGRFYVIAPENACGGQNYFNAIGLKSFEEVWQYGSNEIDDADEPWKLDGVAPQCPMNGDMKFNPDAGSLYGRVEIVPEKYKSFLDAHSITNYGWIFTQLEGRVGAVTSRESSVVENNGAGDE